MKIPLVATDPAEYPIMDIPQKKKPKKISFPLNDAVQNKERTIKAKQKRDEKTDRSFSVLTNSCSSIPTPNSDCISL